MSEKMQLAVKVDNDVLEGFNATSDLLVKTGLAKTKGDVVRYLVDQVNLKRMLADSEWDDEIKAMTHYSEQMVGLFKAVITKTKTQRDVENEKKEQELQALRDKIAEMESFTKSFQDELKQRDQLIGEQARQIEQLKAKTAEQGADYEQLMTQYKSVHTLFEEANENRALVLKEKERHIETVEKRLEEQTQAVAGLEAAHKTVLEQLQAQKADGEAKAEQQRTAYEERIEAMRSSQEAARAALREELERKYEQRLADAQKEVQALTAAATKADTLRQLAEEQLQAQGKKPAARKSSKKVEEPTEVQSGE